RQGRQTQMSNLATKSKVGPRNNGLTMAQGAVKVLAITKRPMSYTEIWDAMEKWLGMRSNGATPELSLSAVLQRHSENVKIRSQPARTKLFVKTERGKYKLISQGRQEFAPSSPAPLTAAEHGAGFRSWEQNKRVEENAVRYVTRELRFGGWRVKNVCTENRGYDLECARGPKVMHVEVKGVREPDAQFILTSKEKRTWEKDPDYWLALVNSALSAPQLKFYPGPPALAGFILNPISYIASARSEEGGVNQLR